MEKEVEDKYDHNAYKWDILLFTPISFFDSLINCIWFCL